MRYILISSGKFLFSILTIIGFLLIILSMFNLEEASGTTDCYDKYGNKIKELTCEEEGMDFKEGMEIYFLIGFLLTIFGLGFWNLSNENDYGTNLFGFRRKE